MMLRLAPPPSVVRPAAAATDTVYAPPGRYLSQFDLFRTVAFVCVIAQHAVLWPVSSNSVAGCGLVMLLHFTRNAFFFLSAFLAAYTQIVRPRRLGALWRRRFSQVLLPYLAWTALDVGYWLAFDSAARSDPLGTFWHYLVTGYYQLYFIVVLLQLFALLPVLLRAVRATRGHHVLVFSVSLGLQLALASVYSYVSAPTGALHVLTHVVNIALNSRCLLAYQVFVVAGLLAADHADELHRLIDRHLGRFVGAAAGAAVFTELFYLLIEQRTHSPGHAAALNQPEAVLWFLAAIVGLVALGRLQARRRAIRGRGQNRLVRWASDASGGYYLAHVVVLQLILQALTAAGLRTELSWTGIAWILFGGTLLGAGLLVAILLHSPLRFLLTGPDRTRQRARLAEDLGGLELAVTSAPRGGPLRSELLRVEAAP